MAVLATRLLLVPTSAAGIAVGVDAQTPVLRIGVERNAPPLSFLDKDMKPSGFSAEYLREIAAHSGLKLVIVPEYWSALQRDFAAGRLDALCNVEITPKRRETMEFSIGHAYINAVSYTRPGAPRVRHTHQFEGKVIAMISGSVAYQDAVSHRGWGGRIVPCASWDDFLRAVRDGSCDFGLAIQRLYESGPAESDLHHDFVDDVTYTFHIAVHRGDAENLARLNDGVAAAAYDGDFDRLYSKWIGPISPLRIRMAYLRPYTIPAGLVMLGIVAAFLWQQNVLRERRRAEVALRASEGKYSRLVERAPDVIYSFSDKRGGLYYSASVEGVLGYPPRELQKSPFIWRDSIEPADREQVRLTIQKAASGEPFDIEYRIRDRGGNVRWLRDRSISSRREGEEILVDGIAIDITERKRQEVERQQIERRLQETQRLESLGVLAGGIAHDFNNLIGGILAATELAAHQLPEESSARRHLNSIRSTSQHAAELCRQMLAYSGRGQFSFHVYSLNLLVEETVDLLRLSIGKKVELRLDLGPGLPLVECDTTQLRQVLMNLVINASEAIGEQNGVIAVSTRETRVASAGAHGDQHDPELPAGNYLCLEVSDTGGGMSPDVLARIFDPFFTTKFTGRGLGLAAVKGIVQAHNGELTVRSSPGAGTTFRLLLPCATGAAAPVPPSTTAESDWRGQGCLLVVDDDELMRETTADLLRFKDFEVITARDGAEAMERFVKEPGLFRLVLMDLTMPHLDGKEAFQKMQQIRKGVKVVLMSGYDSNDVATNFTEDKPAGYLSKPFSEQELLEAVRKALASG